jgi:hypothetical protein
VLVPEAEVEFLDECLWSPSASLRTLNHLPRSSKSTANSSRGGNGTFYRKSQE